MSICKVETLGFVHFSFYFRVGVAGNCVIHLSLQSGQDKIFQHMMVDGVVMRKKAEDDWWSQRGFFFDIYLVWRIL